MSQEELGKTAATDPQKKLQLTQRDDMAKSLIHIRTKSQEFMDIPPVTMLFKK
jgi:hypothetical protein